MLIFPLPPKVNITKYHIQNYIKRKKVLAFKDTENGK